MKKSWNLLISYGNQWTGLISFTDFLLIYKKNNIQDQSVSFQWIFLEFWVPTGLIFSIVLICSHLPRCHVRTVSGPLRAEQDVSSVSDLPKASFVNMGFEFSSGCQCARVLEHIKGEWGVQRLLSIQPRLRHQHCVPTSVCLTVCTQGLRMLTEHSEPEGDIVSHN